MSLTEAAVYALLALKSDNFSALSLNVVVAALLKFYNGLFAFTRSVDFLSPTGKAQRYYRNY